MDDVQKMPSHLLLQEFRDLIDMVAHNNPNDVPAQVRRIDAIQAEIYRRMSW